MRRSTRKIECAFVLILSAGGVMGEPSLFTKDEQGRAVLAMVRRMVGIADASISVEDDICFGGRLEDRATCIELF